MMKVSHEGKLVIQDFHSTFTDYNCPICNDWSVRLCSSGSARSSKTRVHTHHKALREAKALPPVLSPNR